MYSKYIIKLIPFVLILALLIVSLPVAAEDVAVSATVTTVTITPVDEGGGGINTSVIFSGFAYPGATVHIWKNGIPVETTLADANGAFSITLTEIYNPNVMYTLYAIDKAYRQSLLLNYPVVVKSGYVTHVSGIRFAPTIIIDKTEVKYGDTLTVSGYALPSQSLELVVQGSQRRNFYFFSNPDGTYQAPLALGDLRRGDYSLYVHYNNDKRISKVIKFTISDMNIPSVELSVNIPGDCNEDKIINLIDFSVAAFWYKKSNPPRCIDTNNDNIINLVDFSILAFYWTG